MGKPVDDERGKVSDPQKRPPVVDRAKRQRNAALDRFDESLKLPSAPAHISGGRITVMLMSASCARASRPASAAAFDDP